MQLQTGNERPATPTGSRQIAARPTLAAASELARGLRSAGEPLTGDGHGARTAREAREARAQPAAPPRETCPGAARARGASRRVRCVEPATPRSSARGHVQARRIAAVPRAPDPRPLRPDDAHS